MDQLFAWMMLPFKNPYILLLDVGGNRARGFRWNRCKPRTSRLGRSSRDDFDTTSSNRYYDYWRVQEDDAVGKRNRKFSTALLFDAR